MLVGSETADSGTDFLLRAYDPPTYMNPMCALFTQGRFHNICNDSLKDTSTVGVTLNMCLPDIKEDTKCKGKAVDLHRLQCDLGKLKQLQENMSTSFQLNPRLTSISNFVVMLANLE